MITHVTTNIANSPIRRETLHKRAYVVAPMVMITSGVHNGSNGPLLYEEGDIKKAIPAWNMKPIVVYHPQINNKGISAADADVLEKQQVGMVMNTAYTGGKLRAEAWIEIERANLVDGRIMEALENNALMEVSTGLFTENEAAAGVWNESAADGGKPYGAIARNHQPDHLALLPDQVGACSIADGAGLLQLNAEAAEDFGAEVMGIARRLVGNKLSHDNIRGGVRKALEAHVPKVKKGVGEDAYTVGPWLVDVYDNFFIYEVEGALYKMGYTNKKNVVAVDGNTEPVVRVTEYRTAKSNKFVGNHAPITNHKPTMKKSEIIDGLIANAGTAWTEGDRETLNTLEEGVLNKMAPKAADKKGEEDEEDADKKGGTPTKNDAAPAADTPAAAPVANTTEAYIEAAPPEIREVLRNGVNAHTKEQAALIEEITANANNTFTAEHLATKGLDELRGMAALAKQAAAPVSNAQQPPMFLGQATLAQGITANHEEGGLATPKMKF